MTPEGPQSPEGAYSVEGSLLNLASVAVLGIEILLVPAAL
jgi:hypothetical protein